MPEFERWLSALFLVGPHLPKMEFFVGLSHGRVLFCFRLPDIRRRLSVLLLYFGQK
jgi:hypothetical protein